MKAVLVFLAAATIAGAQPRQPEVFGQIGWVRVAGDESAGPSSAQWGGAAMIPFARRFAIDLDATTVKASEARGSTDSFETRRTYLNAGVVARWGNERTYFFLGGGFGLEHDRSASRTSNLLPGVRPPNAVEVSPGVFEFRSRETDQALVFRTGFVQAIRPHLVTRFDLFWSHRFVLPSIGVRAAIGYRF